jgi:hypothetical protein
VDSTVVDGVRAKVSSHAPRLCKYSTVAGAATVAFPSVAALRRRFDYRRDPRLFMRNLILIPFLLTAAPQLLPAQSGADVLTGLVTDLAGHPVANARVGATSLGTGVIRFNTTDESGRYRIYFPETAPSYAITARRIGFSPVQRTITRRTDAPEKMIVDLQFGGTPLALSVVEINGDSYAPKPREIEKLPTADVSIPNPVAEILALRDTLHLSAVEIVALSDLSDSLQARNGRRRYADGGQCGANAGRGFGKHRSGCGRRAEITPARAVGAHSSGNSRSFDAISGRREIIFLISRRRLYSRPGLRSGRRNYARAFSTTQ